MSEKDMRLFAVWCAREALKLVDNPDPRSITACNIAEKYARGEATEEELTDARSDAFLTVSGDAEYAAWSAAGSIATSAARAAARIASDAARDAQIDQLMTYF